MLLGLCGCGGGGHRPPVDEALDTALQGGADAIALRRFDDALRSYATAYGLAVTRDDAAAIGIAGVGRTVALERAGRAAEAVGVAAVTRADLERRFRAAPSMLDLAEGAALLQLGRPEEAARVVLPAETAAEAAVRERAVFLEGMAADALGDRQAVAAAVRRLSGAGANGKPDPTSTADRLELEARLALAQGAGRRALEQATMAADLRRTALDYRGMRRNLRLAAEAAALAGERAVAAALLADAAASESGGAAPVPPPGAEPLDLR